MRKQFLDIISCTIAMLLLISCATTKETKTQEYTQTEAEQRMRKLSNNYNKTVWQGVLLGAAVAGTATAIATDGDVKESLFAAGLGALGGGFTGKYIADKQEKFATREEQLNSVIADVRKSNKENEEYIASVKEVLEEDKRRVAAINQKYEQGVATKEELEVERERIKDKQAVVEKSIKGAKEKLEVFENAQEKYESDRLAQEIRAYEDQMNTLEALAEAFASA